MNSQRLSGVADPVATQDAVTMGYADRAHRTGWLVFVDQVNGNDSTGERGRNDRPFLQLNAARTAAQAGDTIVVLPGSYLPTAPLLKNGVNWHFHAGAIVQETLGVVDMWSDAGSTVACKVTGWGQFITEDTRVVKVSRIIL